MRYKWGKYNWWIYCVIIAIAVFVILYYCYPDTEQENARYILSAISQGLAAILALVFTITLVVSQMTRKYIAMDKIIFRPETIFLMIIFGFGVVTPLLVLKFGFWRHGINLSIAIAFFCVFSLIPFLKGVNGVLKYDIGLGNLHEEVTEALGLLQHQIAVNRIREVNEIAERAIKEYRKDVVSSVLRILSNLGINSAKGGFWYVTYQIVCVFKNIGVKSVEKRFEGSYLTNGIIMIVTQSINSKVGGDFKSAVLIEAINGLRDIGVKAAEKGLKDSTLAAGKGLVTVGEKSGNEEALLALWCLGAAVTKYMPEYVDDVIRNIKKLEETISGDWLPLAERICMENYPELKDAFEKFKRINNK